MSARAHEVLPDDEEEEEKEDKNNTKPESMTDDSLSSDDDNNDGDNPICAQIEVLYTMSQIFKKKKIGEVSKSTATFTTPSATNASEHEEQSQSMQVKGTDDYTENKDINDDESKKEHTIETAWVGVFEGWIDGKHPLRWKLVDNRPAWELPLMRG